MAGLPVGGRCPRRAAKMQNAQALLKAYSFDHSQLIISALATEGDDLC